MTGGGWYAVAFLAGAVAEHYSDLWTIRWNTATQARSYPLSWPRMRRHVAKTVLLGWGLLTLGAVDMASIFGGVSLFLTVLAGSYVGSAVATIREMVRKWRKKVESLHDTEEEE